MAKAPPSFARLCAQLPTHCRSLWLALNRVDPQLEVHVPDVARAVLEARRARGTVITRVEAKLAALEGGEEDVDLESVVRDAESAQAEVEQATESVRAFLAREFSFKESF